ncbi:sugar transferase [Anopheles sinensis]|uniref:Sugar transferase n=1 Tax=Anopheles sinensis TaxID=74873 RepID=A0A084VCT4_ANOSI|nr:sugar transferase [Anopheles sinensis]
MAESAGKHHGKLTIGCGLLDGWIKTNARRCKDVVFTFPFTLTVRLPVMVCFHLRPSTDGAPNFGRNVAAERHDMSRGGCDGA